MDNCSTIKAYKGLVHESGDITVSQTKRDQDRDGSEVACGMQHTQRCGERRAEDRRGEGGGEA